MNYISDINNPEDSYYAWDLFPSRTSYMRSMLKGTETGDRFIQYFKPAVAKQFEEIGFSVDRGMSPVLGPSHRPNFRNKSSLDSSESKDNLHFKIMTRIFEKRSEQQSVHWQ